MDAVSPANDELESLSAALNAADDLSSPEVPIEVSQVADDDFDSPRARARPSPLDPVPPLASARKGPTTSSVPTLGSSARTSAPMAAVTPVGSLADAIGEIEDPARLRERNDSHSDDFEDDDVSGHLDKTDEPVRADIDDVLSSMEEPDVSPIERAKRGPSASALGGGTYEPAAVRAASASPMDEAQLVEERVLPEIPTLRFAVYEDAAHLASAQGAIVASGHVVAIGGAGRDAVARVIAAIRGGAVDAVMVALPGGEEVIDAALSLEPRRPVVIAAVSAPSSVEAVGKATASGADLAVLRPHDVATVAPIMLAAARLQIERRAAMSARGAEAVLRARLDALADPEPRGLLPFEMFQRVLELEIKRAKRFEYPLSVALFAVEVAPPPPPPGIRGILRARAGNALINTIRDIDIATQLDHERFLVLLPYTDLKGAAGLGRRVIAAVATGDAVTAAGRSFPPRVVGAVAGGGVGAELSFANLMKKATRALEQARRDGAELAVQP